MMAAPGIEAHSIIMTIESGRNRLELRKARCDADRCPIYAMFKDHSQMSQNVGTADTSVSGPILQVIRQAE
jgi:hypothetical protein